MFEKAHVENIYSLASPLFSKFQQESGQAVPED